MKHAESEPNLTAAARMPEPKLAKSWLMRWLCIALAWLCLAAFDFYFLAAVFAAKGSKRLHGWIVNNAVIAPILQQWHAERTLPLKVKLFSLASMGMAACILVWTVPHPWAVGAVIALMAFVQLWMWLKA